VPYYDPNGAISDAARWNSSNPIGSILNLDLEGDNGSVIVSSYSSQQWTVSTINTPIDGTHPVSGNRQWGFEYANGVYTFYVTGVDRLTTGRHELAQYIFGIPFNKADALWEGYQQNLATFVNSHSGLAYVGSAMKERPDFDALWQYFTNQISLEQLKAVKGCN